MTPEQSAARITELEKKNQRLSDLVRYKRHDLHNEDLISNEEYAELMQNPGAVSRLVGYDKAKAEFKSKLAELEQELAREKSGRQFDAETLVSNARAKDQQIALLVAQWEQLRVWVDNPLWLKSEAYSWFVHQLKGVMDRLAAQPQPKALTGEELKIEILAFYRKHNLCGFLLPLDENTDIELNTKPLPPEIKGVLGNYGCIYVRDGVLADAVVSGGAEASAEDATARKTRVNYTDCVRVEIDGSLREGRRWEPLKGGAELVLEFLRWQGISGTFPLFTGVSGLGYWVGYFSHGQMPAVRQWVKQWV